MAARELHHLAAVCTLYLCPLDIAPEVADFILVFILRMTGNNAAVTIKQESIMQDCCFTTRLSKIIAARLAKSIAARSCKIIAARLSRIIAARLSRNIVAR